MDDVSALQQLTPGAMNQDVVLFDLRPAIAWKNDIRLARSVPGVKHFRGEAAPQGAAISYWLRNIPPGDVRITIRDLQTGQVFRTMSGTKLQGMNRVSWNLCSDPQPVQPGQFAFGGGGCGGGGRGGGGGGGAAGQPQGIARTAMPGSYAVTLTVNGRDYSRSLSILDDVWMETR